MVSNEGLSELSTRQMKGLAILFVLLGHSRMWLHLDNIVPPIFSTAGAWGVTIFLILSGYGLTESFLKKGFTPSFVKRRFVKVIVPYSVISAIWFLIDYIFFHRTVRLINFFTTLIGLNIFNPSLDPTMWYITFLLMWYVIFFVVFLVPMNKVIRTAILFLFAFVLQHYSIFLASDWKYNYYAFPIGVLLSYTKIIISRNDLRAILNNVAICVFFAMIPKVADFSLYTQISFATVAIALWIITLIPAINLKSKFLGFIGSISYEIYLLEGAIALKYQTLSIFNNPLESLVFFLILVICLSYVFKLSLSYILKHLTNLLSIHPKEINSKSLLKG